MKTMIGVAAALLSFAAFAAAQPTAPGNAQSQNDAQVLADAVSALKTTDTGLASRLQAVADKPPAETGVPGVPSGPSLSTQDVQTVQQAVSELRSSRPDVAARLDGYLQKLPQ